MAAGGGPTPETAVEARANAWYALARVFDRPDAWPGGMEELIPSAFASLGDELSDRALAAGAALARATEAPAVTHARLFLGPFEVKAPPWASSYLDPEGRLMGPHSEYAARAYAEAGLGPREGPNDAPDHVTHELEFMYFLAFQEATTGEREWGGRARRFWSEHLGLWLPRFAQEVTRAGKDTFYGPLGRLTGSFCARMNTELDPVRPSSG